VREGLETGAQDDVLADAFLNGLGQLILCIPASRNDEGPKETRLLRPLYV
jgi:hypothetical protein